MFTQPWDASRTEELKMVQHGSSTMHFASADGFAAWLRLTAYSVQGANLDRLVHCHIWLTLTSKLMNCRQAANGYFCQAPQTPTYNMSTSGASAPGLPSTAGRRHLSQAAPAPAPGNQCNQIGYYMTCGEHTA